MSDFDKIEIADRLLDIIILTMYLVQKIGNMSEEEVKKRMESHRLRTDELLNKLR